MDLFWYVLCGKINDFLLVKLMVFLLPHNARTNRFVEHFKGKISRISSTNPLMYFWSKGFPIVKKMYSVFRFSIWKKSKSLQVFSGIFVGSGRAHKHPRKQLVYEQIWIRLPEVNQNKDGSPTWLWDSHLQMALNYFLLTCSTSHIRPRSISQND